MQKLNSSVTLSANVTHCFVVQGHRGRWQNVIR